MPKKTKKRVLSTRMGQYKISTTGEMKSINFNINHAYYGMDVEVIFPGHVAPQIARLSNLYAEKENLMALVSAIWSQEDIDRTPAGTVRPHIATVRYVEREEMRASREGMWTLPTNSWMQIEKMPKTVRNKKPKENSFGRFARISDIINNEQK